MAGQAVFATAVGTCGVSWRPEGLVGVRLPPAAPAAPGEVPGWVADACAAMTALLDGSPADLSGVPLCWDGVGPFALSVYELTRTIPAGATLSYGQVAARLGAPGAARAVGQALGANPLPIVVPCHRVLAAGGAIGGFSAGGGAAVKRRMLELEGAPGFQTLF